MGRLRKPVTRLSAVSGAKTRALSLVTRGLWSRNTWALEPNKN